MEELMEQVEDYGLQQRTSMRLKQHIISQLLCLGRHTITGLLCTGGRQFQDWTADYRLYAHSRVEPADLFRMIQAQLTGGIEDTQPLVVALDDSMLRKTGKHIYGVGYQRDPLSPAFHVNLINAQRVLQISAALPHPESPGVARMIPIDFVSVPKPQKPKKNAPKEQWQAYYRLKEQMRLSQKGADRLIALRSQLDQQPKGRRRTLWVCVDGRYTNATLLQQLPPRTVLVGRVRGDANLSHLPKKQRNHRVGRKLQYGDKAPTPEALRKDNATPWQEVCVYAFGQRRPVKFKCIKPLRWRASGGKQVLQLVVIAPFKYRRRKSGPWLYRKPTYLICTDPEASVQQVIQSYLWRWDIEVNFRDEKQIIGVGQAQVRKKSSVQRVPATAVAAYALLLLAGVRAFGMDGSPDTLPPPRWRSRKRKKRATTSDLVRQLRCELWGKALDLSNFSGFTSTRIAEQKPEKYRTELASSVLYAAN